LVLNFTDNVCLDGTGGDVKIWEVFHGETYDVEVGLTGGALTNVASGATGDAMVDVDTGTFFNQIRLTALDSENITSGADIDAVQCLNSISANGAVIEIDGCDVGGGGDDVDSVLAYSDGTTIFVHLNLCDDIDPKVKYRVHFDYTDRTNQDLDDTDEAPDTPDNTGCKTTSDDTMMRRVHKGNPKDTGPGMITSERDMLWYEVDYNELTKNGASLGTNDQVLIWVDTQFKGSNDRAPTTEGGDSCSKPQNLGEVLAITLQ